MQGGTCGKEGDAISLQLSSAKGQVRFCDEQALQLLGAGPQPLLLSLRQTIESH